MGDERLYATVDGQHGPQDPLVGRIVVVRARRALHDPIPLRLVETQLLQAELEILLLELGIDRRLLELGERLRAAQLARRDQPRDVEPALVYPELLGEEVAL